jgi:hypothetical protein
MTTIHRARWPLSVVIPLLAAANFLLVLAICLALIGLPMGRGSDEVLLRPVSDRAAAIAGDIDSGLMLFPTEDWDQLLESESQRLGVTLALIEPNGRLVAGPDLALTDEVAKAALLGATPQAARNDEGGHAAAILLESQVIRDVIAL